ncbi:MAG TPA: YfcC family protein [Chloroflexi bacterium]|nr:YfcC family protein [Chloroflexota bacterium]
MAEKSGAQISKKAFTQSVMILLVIMLVAGVLTRVVPAGTYDRISDTGRELIKPDSFHFTDKLDYPIWRWFTAPVEVLWGDDSLLVIVISLFILMVGGAFAVLDKSGILKAALGRIVVRFGDRKYALLLLISFFFMALGAFFGIFEEVVPLVPLVLSLSYYLGWDALVGLGMSILATNLGFSAAITNPFTIGVAQELAGLPLFSGSWFRIPIFIAIYAAFSFFLTRYAKKVERNPEASLVYEETRANQEKFKPLDLSQQSEFPPAMKSATIFFLIFVIMIVAILIGAPFISFLSDYALPLVGLFFLVGGVGAGLISSENRKDVWKALVEGMGGIAPGILLILMAVSIKHIVVSGGIMDTILFQASQLFQGANPFVSSVLIYLLALLIEFFVASGSAKAFLMMPILLPLADLVGVTRQITVTAYCFGDGFSNMIYPTNPVLLIVLGLTVVGYPKWLRWILPLWGMIVLITLAFLALGVAIGYGPF